MNTELSEEIKELIQHLIFTNLEFRPRDGYLELSYNGSTIGTVDYADITKRDN